MYVILFSMLSICVKVNTISIIGSRSSRIVEYRIGQAVPALQEINPTLQRQQDTNGIGIHEVRRCLYKTFYTIVPQLELSIITDVCINRTVLVLMLVLIIIKVIV